MKYRVVKAATIVAVTLWVALIAALLTGCVSYATVDQGEGAKQCKATVRGSFFSFGTPSVIAECRAER